MEQLQQPERIEHDADKPLTQQIHALCEDEELVIPISLYWNAKSYISGRVHKTSPKRFETSVDSAVVPTGKALIRRVKDAEQQDN